MRRATTKTYMTKTAEQLFVDKIIKELNDYQSNDVYLADKVKFNQAKTIERIIRHQNNTFEKASDKKRFFFNIGNSRLDTVVKKIDLDTKDIQLYAEGDKIAENILLRSELRQYLKDYKWGQKINELEEIYADFGNVVIKKDDDKFYSKVNLANLKVIDPTAETLEDTAVIEEHKYNATEFRRVGNASGWENVDKAIAAFSDDDSSPYFYVYERYGEMSVADYKQFKGQEISDGDRDKFIETVAIVAINRPKLNNRLVSSMSELGFQYGFVLFLEENKGEKGADGKIYYKPYKEAHYDAYQGRWLRKGLREKLFDYQDRANILGNQIYEAMKWSSIHVFWSPDGKLGGRNILSSIEQGQIIQTDALNVLPVEERNLAAFVNEWNKLMELADKECQTFEVATGEGLPSGTTLGQVQIQTATVGEHFNYKREKFGLFLSELFNDWVLPDLIKKLNEEHILEIAGDPSYMDTYLNVAARGLLVSQYLKLAALSGGVITKEQEAQLLEAIKQQLLQSPKQIVKILKDYYKNILPKIEVVTTGESVNKQNRINSGMALLSYITNPVIMSDPTSKGIVLEIADTLGFNVTNAGAQQVQQMAQQQPGQQVQQPKETPQSDSTAL